jgi:hypothetical protein
MLARAVSTLGQKQSLGRLLRCDARLKIIPYNLSKRWPPKTPGFKVRFTQKQTSVA